MKKIIISKRHFKDRSDYNSSRFDFLLDDLGIPNAPNDQWDEIEEIELMVTEFKIIKAEGK